MTTRETIKSNIRKHLVEDNGLLFCQAALGCGFVQNTVPSDIPNHKGIEELPTSDSSNGGVVCGAALMGRRPIYVIRFQGFLWYNAVSLVNYAAKSKEMWGMPCPVFIRGIGVEGGIGPVASNMHHSIICHMPGIKVFAPMTSKEWQYVWDYYLTHDEPVFCSEHRRAYDLDRDLKNKLDHKSPDVTIIAISAARLEAEMAVVELEKEGYKINLVHQFQLKPAVFSNEILRSIIFSKEVLIVDTDFTQCGISEHIAYIIQTQIGFAKSCVTMGLEDRTAGFGSHCDNMTPSKNEIVEMIRSLV
jgi:acetoin:2,6-dichlorophenolindophenol oxidoreductase subunit beta